MRPRGDRSTPAGEHRPVLLDEVLAVLDPRPGGVVVDCTVGFAGHAAELQRRVGPTGRLIGLDLDPVNLERAEKRLAEVGHSYSLHHLNFAGVRQALAAAGVDDADIVLADLGVSSMQIDDIGRGFSYMRDGPLDMRMDPTRGKTAAELLATLPESELARAFAEFGDEPQAVAIAAAIVADRARRALATTRDLRDLIERAAHVKIEKAGPGVAKPWQQKVRPVARVFQALRILVNRELANLTELLRVLPEVLASGGRAAVNSFHSGEDRLVKQAFRDGLRAGVYSAVSEEAVRAGDEERQTNPRSRSAKLRWATK
ncbi:MAG TPA: 16S rRNA (cytosine(1402)-N(4))-methyltransferase RsmH [Gemmataceae bacterium]|nr:16S rRNA (cytosine(1402)-N(4))-methyltransferase RsmH [Gemmataceae bacterium]